MKETPLTSVSYIAKKTCDGLKLLEQMDKQITSTIQLCQRLIALKRWNRSGRTIISTKLHFSAVMLRTGSNTSGRFSTMQLLLLLLCYSRSVLVAVGAVQATYFQVNRMRLDGAVPL